MTEAAGDPNFMTSLARGLTVIRAFSDREPKLSIAEVARLTGLSRAAARRCLHTLETLGYAGSEGRSFFLRPKVLALGHAFLSGRSLAGTIQPFLERVSEALHESSSAAVLDEDEIVYIARAATKRIMSVGLSIGSRLPAYCTSLGRVLLAALPAAELDDYFATLKAEALTERTVTERAALRRSVEQTRQRGYALVDQELEIGLRSVSIPLQNSAGQVVAAMNVSTQAQRVSRREIERRFLPAMRSAAEDLRLALA
jgi:IclR family transcriptional regulator, pca regulon regulatory protein